MKTRNSVLLPKAQKTLSTLGENLKLARLRRKYSTQQVAERANISRPTLLSIEKGNPNVSIGAYIKVLFVLGLDKDILQLASDDTLGRKLQDAKLIVKGRAPKAKNKRLTDGSKE
ncbi:MAG: helix-turn-helix domain-containing protein [Bacteroidales bacterium]|nr:helix-turn-helix domain-containing protein [Bacteroidales bacterium]